jgi:hypothetical protein
MQVMAHKTGIMYLEFTQVILTPDDVATFYTGRMVLGTIEEVHNQTFTSNAIEDWQNLMLWALNIQNLGTLTTSRLITIPNPAIKPK